MTNYALSIRDHNIKAHVDIEEDLAKCGTGLFTFTLRVNNGNIVDYSNTEYVDAKAKYGIVKALIIEQVIIQESRPSHDLGERSTRDPVRDDNS